MEGTAAQIFAFVLKWNSVFACTKKEVHGCIGSWTNLRLSFSSSGVSESWVFNWWPKKDAGVRAEGGHPARSLSQRPAWTLNSRRSLTRWQEPQTTRSFSPHGRVRRSIRPLTGRHIQTDAGSVTCPLNKSLSGASSGPASTWHLVTNWLIKVVKQFRSEE